MVTNEPLPYNKLLKKCDLLHSAPLDKLYKYLFFYESIFRYFTIVSCFGAVVVSFVIILLKCVTFVFFYFHNILLCLCGMKDTLFISDVKVCELMLFICFRHVIKNKSEEIMISADILKLPRNDIFCYIGILEEPGDVEWYYNRFFDEEKRYRDLIKKNAVGDTIY